MKWFPIRYPGTDAEVNIAAVYPDGVIVLRRLFGSGADLLSPLWWIPLRDTEPDLENAVRPSEPPGTATRGGSFFRHADQIAWVDYSRHADNSLPPQLQSPPRLYVFDIAAGKVRLIDSGENPRGCLLAFDGTHAATGMHVIDITNAKVSSMPSYTRFVGISRGALYSVHDAGDTLEVYSAPVGAPTESKLVRRIRRMDLGPDVASFDRDYIQLLPGKSTSNHHAIPIESVFLAHLGDVLWWDGNRWRASVASVGHTRHRNEGNNPADGHDPTRIHDIWRLWPRKARAVWQAAWPASRARATGEV